MCEQVLLSTVLVDSVLTDRHTSLLVTMKGDCHILE